MGHRTEKGYRNPWPRFESHGFRDFITWMLTRRTSDESSHTSAVPDREPDPAASLRAASDRFSVTWIGHATVLIRLDGAVILTDPMWSERASPVSWTGPKRYTRPGMDLADLPPVDIVIISHNHYDHLDLPTIRRLGTRPVYIVPLGLGGILRENGAETIRELDWWESAEVAGVTVTATPAQHFSGRGFTDRNKTLWCGWVIRGEAGAAYFAGDTGFFPGFAEIGERLGPFDIACLPIGAFRPEWFMGPVHTGPEDALRALDMLRAARMLAIHWGTFSLADDPPGLAPSLLRDKVRERGLDPGRIWTLRLGETRAVLVPSP